MKYKTIIISLCLIIFSGLIFFNFQSDTSNHKQLNLREKSYPLTYNAYLANDMISNNVLINTQATLKTKDLNQNIINYAAKKINYNKNNFTFSIEINDNLKFENGDKITSNNYIDALYYVLEPKNKSVNSNILIDNVIGAKQFYNKSSNTIPGLKKISNNIFEIHLNKDFKQFENYFSNLIFSPLNFNYLKQHKNNFGTKAQFILSSGPYKYLKKEANKIIFTKNENWVLNKPNFDHINFNIVEQDNVAVKMFNENKLNSVEVNDVTKKLLNSKNIITKSNKTASSYYLMANSQSTTPQDNKLIFSSLNLKYINKTFFNEQNETIESIIPQRDVFKSLKIINNTFNRESKLKPQHKQIKFLVASEFLSSTNFNAFIKYLIQQMSLKGFQVNLITKPSNFIISEINKTAINSIRNYDYVLSGWNPQNSQTNEFFEMFNTTSNQNVINLNNSNYNKLLNDFNINTQNKYEKANEILKDYLLNLWVNQNWNYYHNNSHVVKSNGYLVVDSNFKTFNN